MFAAIFAGAFLLAFAKANIVSQTDRYRTNLEEFKHVCKTTGHTVHGFIWSRCHDENNWTHGCVFEGKEYEIGDEFTTEKARYRCEEEDGFIMIIPVACRHEGQIIELGEKKKIGSFIMQCQPAENGIRLAITGCTDSDDREVPIGHQFRKGSFIFECVDDGNKVYEQAVACEYEGELLQFGEKVKAGDFYMQCTRRGERSARLSIVGCAGALGEYLEDGDRTSRGQILYKCQKRTSSKGKTDFTLVAIGCLGHDHRAKIAGPQEFLFGDIWEEKYQDKITYQMQCREKKGKVGPKIVGCTFWLEDEVVRVYVGCGRRAGNNKVVLCKKLKGGQVMARMSSMSSKNTYESILDKYNVKPCYVE